MVEFVCTVAPSITQKLEALVIFFLTISVFRNFTTSHLLGSQINIHLWWLLVLRIKTFSTSISFLVRGNLTQNITLVELRIENLGFGATNSLLKIVILFIDRHCLLNKQGFRNKYFVSVLLLKLICRFIFKWGSAVFSK